MRKIAAIFALVFVSMPTTLIVDKTPAGAYSIYLCKSADYRCTTGGYNATSAQRSGWPWALYGGSFPSHNAYGPHNCTLYAAFRLQQDGITLHWHGNAYEWARVGAANGVKVDQTPAVGAIAQWDSGHVAYVEAVTKRGVITTDDNYTGAYTTRQLLTKSANWPSHFLHFVSKKTTTTTTTVRRTTTTTVRPTTTTTVRRTTTTTVRPTTTTTVRPTTTTIA